MNNSMPKIINFPIVGRAKEIESFASSLISLSLEQQSGKIRAEIMERGAKLKGMGLPSALILEQLADFQMALGSVLHNSWTTQDGSCT
ncbi:DUF6074 family protein [Nostoc sp. DedVER01b]|uniref:DUF6074 family protein n=1 Tax=Nostoc sp. DedVER01b TaxID=3075404 RepID=UPI002AD2C7F2|nr:DUF6074 family protein [Nostoc sp. DedVER01b]MDZ8110744.1 DUF6074 family protein [Nostoc sp. DedVER01b]